MASVRCASSFHPRVPGNHAALYGGNANAAGTKAYSTLGADRLSAPRNFARLRPSHSFQEQTLFKSRGWTTATRPGARKDSNDKFADSISAVTSFLRQKERRQLEVAKVGEISSFTSRSKAQGLRIRCKRRTNAVVPSIALIKRHSSNDYTYSRQSHNAVCTPALLKHSLIRRTGCSRQDLHGQHRKERNLSVCSSTGLVTSTADFGPDGPSLVVDGEVQDFGLNEDVILANVPVQSKEEQEKLARTPAHPSALKWMFAAYTANCTAERTFRFAVPAVIGLLSNSLLPIAIISFAGQVGVFALGPVIGDLLDETPRLPALKVLATMQVTSMVASACVTLYAFHSGASACSTAAQLIRRPWFIFLTLAGVVERLAGIGSGVAYERDWVVQLAGPNRHIALAEANALLRRLDLGSEIVGPFSLGLVLSRFTPAVSLGIAATAVAAFLPLQLLCIHMTDKISRGALRRYSLEQRAREATPPKRKNLWEALLNGWRLYLAQPVLPASIAYVMLYFNAVLSPGGLITSFLTQQGISPQVIGGFRGACALFGFAATFLSAWVIERWGLLTAGAIALSFQATCLAMSVLVYIGRPAGAASKNLMIGFLACVVFSRLGMWTYDVVDTQIFQTAIPDSHSSVVSTTELSLCSLAELIMLGVAMAAEDPRYFGSLAALSMASVAGAAVVYCRWILRPCLAKKQLFNHDITSKKILEPTSP